MILDCKGVAHCRSCFFLSGRGVTGVARVEEQKTVGLYFVLEMSSLGENTRGAPKNKKKHLGETIAANVALFRTATKQETI